MSAAVMPGQPNVPLMNCAAVSLMKNSLSAAMEPTRTFNLSCSIDCSNQSSNKSESFEAFDIADGENVADTFRRSSDAVNVIGVGVDDAAFPADQLLEIDIGVNFETAVEIRAGRIRALGDVPVFADPVDAVEDAALSESGAHGIAETLLDRFLRNAGYRFIFGTSFRTHRKRCQR